MRYFIVIILFVFCSCSTTKDVATSDNSTLTTNVERRTVYRPSDTVRITIPNITYKDTVITKVSYDSKTIATVRYDSQGNKEIECTASEIKETYESIIQDLKKDIKESKKVERSFNPQYFLYGLGVLIFLVIIGGAFMLYFINSFKKTIIETMVSK